MEPESITANERQPWTKYVNNGYKCLIIGAVVRSEYSNIRYLHLIIGNFVQKSQKWFPRVEITFPLQVGIFYILPYNQIMKRNNQIIKMNNQILKIL